VVAVFAGVTPFLPLLQGKAAPKEAPLQRFEFHRKR